MFTIFGHNHHSQLLFITCIYNSSSLLLFTKLVHNLCSQILFTNFFKTLVQNFCSQLFSQSISLTQYVVLSVCPPVCLSVRLFQLASESLRDIVVRRRSDYCPHGGIFSQLMFKTQLLFPSFVHHSSS